MSPDHDAKIIKKLQRRFKGTIFYLLDTPHVKEYTRITGEVYSTTTSYFVAFIDKGDVAKLGTFRDPYSNRYGVDTTAKLESKNVSPWSSGRLSKAHADILYELLENGKLDFPIFDLYSMKVIKD